MEAPEELNIKLPFDLAGTTTSSVLKGLLIFQRGGREEQNIYDNTDQTELLHIAAQPLWKMFDSIHYAKQ